MWLLTLCALATIAAAVLAITAFRRGWLAHAAVACVGGAFCLALIILVVLARYDASFRAILDGVPDIAWHISAALVSVAGIAAAYGVAGWLRGRR